MDITKQGSKIPYTLYISTGGVYRELGKTGYYEGESASYYTRSKYADYGELYWSGGDETVSVGTDEYTAALYTAGTAHSGGLYTNFELAKLTTRDVTALTV